MRLNGDVASATFTGQATHVRERDGSEVWWSCGGSYECKFERHATGWKMDYLQFTLNRQQGST